MLQELTPERYSTSLRRPQDLCGPRRPQEASQRSTCCMASHAKSMPSSNSVAIVPCATVTVQPTIERALHAASVTSLEPRCARTIGASMSAVVLPLSEARASDERSGQQSAAARRHRTASAPAAHRKSVLRRPSALLRRQHAARCRSWQARPLPRRAAAAAAHESTGCGAHGWTAAPWMDGHVARCLFTARMEPLL